MWVIDVVDECVVEGDNADRYLTLSYVWGGARTLQATTANIEQLRQPGSLTRDKVVLPKTIRQAINVTQLLGERYIWIDQLSILQDDYEQKHGQIKRMAEIYANSYLTLVAATGNTAHSGLVDDIDQMLNELPVNEEQDENETSWPNFHQYMEFCYSYSRRDFTYNSDVVAAFAGTATLLAKSFLGGILYGLPVLFFDIALLWNYHPGSSTRKWDTAFDESNRPPSWSWMSWHGQLVKGGLEIGFEGTVEDGRPSTVSITPLVQWCFTGESGARIAIANKYHKYKHLAQDGKSIPPPGWSRAESSSRSSGSHGKNVYLTPNAPGIKFRFPVPLVDSSCSEITMPMPISNKITCKTERAFFFLRRPDPVSSDPVQILDAKWSFSGIITSRHESFFETRMRVELIAISTDNVARHDLWYRSNVPAEGRKLGGIWEFYNVLWIEWTDDVAYRIAVGHIDKGAWEAADRKFIHVVLG
ncbi:HET-like protein [Alternaria alternata]|nr:HET-like protein [Alternaria alternata]